MGEALLLRFMEFYFEGEAMRYIVNSREMKLYDTNTTEKFFVPSMVLMERAAVSFVEELKNQKIDLTRTLVVCGSGNNGGDGYAIARLIKLAGNDVDVVTASGAKQVSETRKVSETSNDRTSGGTEANLLQKKIWLAYQNEILREIPEEKAYTAVIDAVFGVGLSRNVEGDYAGLIERMNRIPGTKIAVDISSGISSDNGNVLGVAFRADFTITFAYEKLGTVLWPGNEYAGKVITKEIGIDERSFLERKPAVAALEDCDLAGLPVRKNHSNKGTYGKLLVIAGSAGMSGAAYLSARAAYCSGCGLVRIFTPEENRVVLQTQLPEAILTTYPAKKADMAALTEAVNWADVIVCGPGIGTTDAASQIVKNVLKNASVPVLMDADALNLIAEDVNVLLRPHTELVVTPHLGEMSRLSGDSVSYIQNHLIEVAEEFARQYNVICVLKDEHTVTAVPYSQAYLNLSGNAGMATAGSGDVLSGVIGGLMAQGMSAEEAAPLGVYLHGRAGDVMRDVTGERGLMASDLFEGLRNVLRQQEQQ